MTNCPKTVNSIVLLNKTMASVGGISSPGAPSLARRVVSPDAGSFLFLEKETQNGRLSGLDRLLGEAAVLELGMFGFESQTCTLSVLVGFSEPRLWTRQVRAPASPTQLPRVEAGPAQDRAPRHAAVPAVVTPAPEGELLRPREGSAVFFLLLAPLTPHPARQRKLTRPHVRTHTHPHTLTPHICPSHA